MALTVLQQPSTLTPAYNKQIFTALSNQVAITDFKYIVEIVCNGDTANTYVENIDKRPDNHLVFDAQEWVKNYIVHYFNPLNTTPFIEVATGKTAQVVFKIKEFYSGIVQSTTTVTYYAFDACLTEIEPLQDWEKFLFKSGVYQSAFLGKESSNLLPDSRVVLGQDVILHFINKQATMLDNIIVELRRGGSVIGGYSIGTLPTKVYDYDTYVMRLNSNYLSGAIVGDEVRVDFFDSTATRINRFSYVFTDICTKYEDYIIYYLDRTGNILPFHFEKVSRETTNLTTNKVLLNKDTLNVVTGQYGSREFQRESHIVSTLEENTLTLNTNWITDAQSIRLKEMFTSPQRWVLIDGLYYSCTLKDSSYEVKKSVNDKLFNYTITVDLGLMETRQRGL